MERSQRDALDDIVRSCAADQNYRLQLRWCTKAGLVQEIVSREAEAADAARPLAGRMQRARLANIARAEIWRRVDGREL